MAATLSLVLHLGIALLAAAMLPGEQSPEIRLSVDLRLLAPPRAEPQKAPESRPTRKPRKDVKPRPRPKPEKVSLPEPRPDKVLEPEPEKIARRELLPKEESSPPESRPSPLAGSSSAVKARTIPSEYQREIQRRISRAQKRYPWQSRLQERREEGVVKVRFEIQADGSISSVAVASGSGYPLLDEAAVEIIHNAAPFPPLPAELGSSSLLIFVPIKFQIR